MNHQHYRTTNLYFAAYLRVIGCQFIECVKTDDRVYFMFEPDLNMRGIKRDYFNNEGKIHALQYTNEIRTMKNLVHETMTEHSPQRVA